MEVKSSDLFHGFADLVPFIGADDVMVLRNGKAELHGTKPDTMLYISFPLDLGLGKDELVSYPAREFFKVITNSFKGNDVISVLIKNDNLIIKNSNSKITLKSISTNMDIVNGFAKLDGVDLDDNDKWYENAEEFDTDLANAIALAIRTPYRNTVLPGVFCNGAEIFNTDGASITIVDLVKTYKKFFVSNDSAKIISKLSSYVNKYDFFGNYLLLFGNQSIKIALICLDAESYPVKGINTLSNNNSKSTADHEAEIPANMDSFIKDSSLFIDKFDNCLPMRVTLCSDKVIVSTENGHGLYESESTGKETEVAHFLIDYRTFIDALDKSRKFYVVKDKIVFQENNWKIILATIAE